MVVADSTPYSMIVENIRRYLRSALNIQLVIASFHTFIYKLGLSFFDK